MMLRTALILVRRFRMTFWSLTWIRSSRRCSDIPQDPTVSMEKPRRRVKRQQDTAAMLPPPLGPSLCRVYFVHKCAPVPLLNDMYVLMRGCCAIPEICSLRGSQSRRLSMPRYVVRAMALSMLHHQFCQGRQRALCALMCVRSGAFPWAIEIVPEYSACMPVVVLCGRGRLEPAARQRLPDDFVAVRLERRCFVKTRAAVRTSQECKCARRATSRMYRSAFVGRVVSVPWCACVGMQ